MTEKHGIRQQYCCGTWHLAIGHITDKQFDEALEPLPLSGKDRVFDAIFEETYDIETATRHEVARWTLFLYSENEYIWPRMDELPNPFSILLGVLVAVVLADVFHHSAIGLCLTVAGYTVVLSVASRLRPKSQKPGDLKVWPFHKQDDFDEAVRHPRLLNGKRTMR